VKLRLILCSDVNILDVNTNRVSSINLIEEISSQQFPIVVPQFSILAVFDKEEGDEEKVDSTLVVKLNDQELARGPIEVNFEGGAKMHRSLVAFQGFVVPVPGRLVVSILQNGKQFGDWSVLVSQVAASPDIQLKKSVSDANGGA
jgi:hypothetical protein